MARADLEKNGMMRHLLASLDAGKDIGHYGRLVFALVARHFLAPDALIEALCKDPRCTEADARALLHQLDARDYSPPRREKVLEFQAHQDFPICPNPEDPDACNVYKDLQFPERVYQHISEYREQKVHAEEAAGAPQG